MVQMSKKLVHMSKKNVNNFEQIGIYLRLG